MLFQHCYLLQYQDGMAADVCHDAVVDECCVVMCAADTIHKLCSLNTVAIHTHQILSLKVIVQLPTFR